MKKLKIFLVLLLLFISISAVSAEGNFTQLQNEINTAMNSIELSQDYEFDRDTDLNLSRGVLINKSNFVVNGNGHEIDGSYQSRILNIKGKNITIMNLKLNNAFYKNSGGAIYSSGNITIINVTFSQNYAKYGGAIYNLGNMNILNSTFSENMATEGGGIYTESQTTITNSVFKNSKNMTFSIIYADENSRLTIEDSSFMNSQSKYATAIYANNNTTIKRSVFKNLHALESGGAIGIKGAKKVTIESCTFENVSAVKNGGAIFLDLGNEERISEGDSLISNCMFINTSGNFGGAILQLGGTVTIANNSFEKCSSLYDGGALYISQAKNAYIQGNNITDSKTGDNGNGGAAYLFESKTIISKSNFINNENTGIYTYSCKNVNINESSFINNTVAIYGVFTDFTMENTNFINNNVSLNNTDYATIVKEKGAPIKVINNSIDVVNLPAKYDLRDWGWVTSIKNQGNLGSCWAFGDLGALESALLKATGIEYDFSEDNMHSSMLRYSKYGDSDADDGVFEKEGVNYILSWFGVMPAQYDSYDELGKISPLITSDENLHIQNAIFVNTRQNSTDNDEVKRAILKYGGVSAGYKNSDDIYTEKIYSYYQNKTKEPSHIVLIVGWDDNYPASNFKETPPGNGAFILKNSWGTEWGDKGYFYISYYDTSLLTTHIGVTFLIENSENYTKNYQTDLGGIIHFFENNESTIKYQNNYESIGNDLISAVGTYFNKNDSNYSFEIYVNNELKHNQNGTKQYDGYHTIKLTSEIPIKEGDNVSVVMMKKTMPYLNESMQHYPENTSLATHDGKTYDLMKLNMTASLKMYTKDLAIYTEDLVKIYKNESQFYAIIDYVKETVIFEINGANYTRISDENGTAHININLRPGDYVIKTTFNGTTVENNIKVLPTLIADNLVKYFRNESQFYITLIDGAGKAVPNTNITMNINGVFYNRTTNENGTARLNINLEPGEYILTAIDPLTCLEMSYNITVLPVLTADDLNMTYLDGSQFAATLVDGKGNALEGVNITFNINGVFYNRTTDENGTARLNIRLMPGEYIITSQYEQAVISNKITIISKED